MANNLHIELYKKENYKYTILYMHIMLGSAKISGQYIILHIINNITTENICLIVQSVVNGTKWQIHVVKN